jgi:hypothetical protein
MQVIAPPPEMFWRQMGGHLRKVETCSAGVTWGIGYDNTAWVYTGGWGGSFLKGEIKQGKYFIVHFKCVLQLKQYNQRRTLCTDM